MQTFLPYPDFNKSAMCLDVKRLGKQRLECKTLLTGGWAYHPCAKMWKPYPNVLCNYTLEICIEWRARGYKDTILDWLTKFMNDNNYIFVDAEKLHWLGNEQLHASHRSNLLRKNPNYYGQFNWTEPNNLSYYWPD